MKSALVVLVATCCLAGTAHAARKSCEELKSEIDANLQANGVQNYVLEAVRNDEVGNRKVVGSCDGGQGKIVYTREGAQPAPAPESGLQNY